MNHATFLQDQQAIKFLSESSFLLDEKKSLSAPASLFFPSKYREENELAQSAKVLSEELLDELTNRDQKEWLTKLGIREMSNLSVVENVICEDGFINKENAIDVLQFVFDVDREENVFDNISRYTLSGLKVLTTKGSLKSASELYLDQAYKSSLFVNFDCDVDAFVSHNYVRNCDDAFEWLVFFKKLGASDNVQVKEVSYGRNTKEFKNMSSYADYAQHHEYNHSDWTGGNYYMFPTRLVVKFVPLLNVYDTNFEMSKFVFEKIFSIPIVFGVNDDYLYGETGNGYKKKAYLVGKGNCDSYQYLGKNYFPWILEKHNILPATNGKLYKVQELYENSEANCELFGTYLPVLDVQCEIDSSWREYLPFKGKCTLNECLDVLSIIWKETDDEKKKENVDRISLLYRHICDNFDLSENGANYAIIQRWGQNNKIMSTDKDFESPSSLVMVSDDLGKIDIGNQIYRGKHIESRNNRFAKLMQAMGVSFINDFDVRYSPNSVENCSLRESLMRKKIFVALLAAGIDCTKDVYSETLQKIGKLLEDVKFIQEESISFVYGDQPPVEKKIYSQRGEFHYVGQWGVANIELLHHDIAKYLTITGGKAAFMAILQMDDFYEIKDYLNEKGYDISMMPEDAEPVTEIKVAVKDINSSEREYATISLSDTSYAGLSKEQMGDALKEAKEAVEERMGKEGFEFTQGLCEDCYGNINGVMKNGKEYPLVVHSYKSNSRPFQLTAFDWEQLARPNSMLYASSG